MKFWYFELILFVLFILVVFSFGTETVLDAPQYVPDAVNGMATIAGTLTAFTGYLISHVIKKLENTSQRWVSKRVAIIIISLGFGLIFVMLGLAELVRGQMIGAYDGARFGMLLIMLAFFEVLFMIVISELEPTKDLSGDL